MQIKDIKAASSKTIRMGPLAVDYSLEDRCAAVSLRVSRVQVNLGLEWFGNIITTEDKSMIGVSLPTPVISIGLFYFK